MPIRVNGEDIPETAVRFEMDRLVRFYSDHLSAEQIRARMGALRRQAVDQAIGGKLLIEQARHMDIRVSRDEVDRRLQGIIRQAGGPEAFHRHLAAQERSEDDVRAAVEQGCRVEKLIEHITAEAPEPGEAEIKAYFDAHADDYARAERTEAQHILVRPAGDSTADRETARSRLQELRARLQEGADFAELAAAHSDCPSGKSTGGSLGWFTRGMMVPAFEKAAFAMAVGELSEVIETPLGFHLIRKQGYEKAGPATFEDARERVRDLLRHVRRGEVLSAYVADLREKATIEIDEPPAEA